MELIDDSHVQWLPQVVLELFSGRFLSQRTGNEERNATFDRALGHFEHSRWSLAFEALVPLADSGDREAARIALLMTTRGPRLFGQAFAASPSQRDRWREAADRAYAAESLTTASTLAGNAGMPERQPAGAAATSA
jgi:hypothetical protein